MNHKIRIIKRGDRKDPKPDRPEEGSPHRKQEITTTIKTWISELKEKQRSDEQKAFKLLRTAQLYKALSGG